MLRIIRVSTVRLSPKSVALRRFPVAMIPHLRVTSRFLSVETEAQKPPPQLQHEPQFVKKDHYSGGRAFVSNEQYAKDKSAIHVAAQKGQTEQLNKIVIELIQRDGSLNSTHWPKFYEAHWQAGTPIDRVVADFPLEFIPSQSDCNRALLSLKKGAIEYTYQFMLHWGMKPNREGVSHLMTSLLSEGQLKKVLSTFDTMLSWGYVPSISQVNLALEAHVRLQDWSAALQLYEEAKRNTIYPSGKTYGLILQVLARTQNWEAAELVWKENVAGKDRRMMDAHGPYMVLLSKAGKADAVQTLFDSLVEVGVIPTSTTCFFVAECLKAENRDYKHITDFMTKHKMVIPKSIAQ